jgi:subtilisin-like proprotein convertase family protein
MKIQTLGLTVLAVFCMCLGRVEILHADTQTFVSTNVPKNITDHTTVTSTITVSGLPAYVTGVTVTLTEIIHSSDSDLEVFLISPAGIRVELFTAVGGSGDNFINTTLNQHAAIQIASGAPPFTGQYQPEGVLSRLNSENPNGTWTLEVTDTATANTGTLNNWSLTISAGTAMDWFTTRISNNSRDDSYPQISGSNVVWQGHDGTDFEIFLYLRCDHRCDHQDYQQQLR